jgi:3-deoxy-D-manno-octulosonic-acid transferase
VSAARLFYSLLVWLAMPWAALYLLYRSRRQPGYRAHWGERFGLRMPTLPGNAPTIWVHAVSVGETRAAEPLIAALAARFPQHRFLLTHMTPTGRAAGAEFAARWPGRIVQSYLPYDLPFAVRRFFTATRPVAGVIMETETWPNLVAAARAVAVPLVLVNARLSARSLQRARRLPTLMRETAEAFTAVLAQSDADAERMRQVGEVPVEVIGNLKFDFTPDAAQARDGARFRDAATRPVLLFASTREGEEAALLDALRTGPWADVRVLIVPRHPQRFDEVARLIAARGHALARRSALAAWLPPPGDAVLLGDSMGEMALYYASADAAYVGGSLEPLGGQNLIEACALGVPVVVGPHTFNFAQATADAIAAGAAVRVADAAAAVAELRAIARDPERRARMGEAGERFARQHRGATARALERIAPLVERGRAP